MVREQYWIWREPLESDYEQLIEFCAKRSSKCTFVLQRPKQFGESCYQFLDGLKEHLDEVVNQIEWPGTRLMGFMAPVYWYRVTPGLTAVLKTKVKALYKCVRPDLPEDLAFYWPDGSVLLGSSSHERFAFLNLTERELNQFNRELPNLRLNKLPPPQLV